ncbi:GNAT family N-acetyltransferase [Fodinicola acaciae]|uniref:GNAT family N-acetyltransferase n=1 Tax=Fodinicola acaciae TaxID=2681555 RepID=UPI0013D4823B|nr:GNAT family protein [Fodinicola acaciae]
MFAIDLTDNARMSPLEPWQAAEFLAHIDRAREHVDPWIPWASRSTNLHTARATLQRYADQQARDGGGIYGIWLHDVLVGGVMFVSLDAKGGVCEIGCWLEPAGQGHGLITRAAWRLIAYAIEERGLNRVEWRNRKDNIRSRNVARRLGMTLDGVLRESYFYAEKHHDEEVWSMLASEWPGRRDAGPATAAS